MTTVPTENPQDATLVDVILETASPWIPWVIGAAIAAAVVYAMIHLHHTGLLSALAGQIRALLVRRGTPKAPQGKSSTPSSPQPETSAWLPKALATVAAIPTLFALPWAAWAVAHVIPAPIWVALPLGVLFDLVMIASVVLALLVPSVSRQASAIGWVSAALAAAAIVVHVGASGALLFAATPLLSKALWGLLVTIRRSEDHGREVAAAKEAEAARLAQEETAAKEAELSGELTFEQKKTIAERKRKAAYEKQLAEADREVEAAEADTEHQRKLAEIRRLGEQQRTMDEESAEVEMARQDLIRKVSASRPASFAVSSGDVPNDLSSLPAPPGSSAVMGFGSAMGSDLGTSRGRPVGDPQLQDLMTYIAAAGSGASVRGAARELRVAPATIRRWRDKAEQQGLNVGALKSTQ